MNWNRNTNEINKKARNSIRNLQRVNHILPFKLRLILYNSLVASHLTYCDTVWGGLNKRNSSKLQRTQNIAAKSIIGEKNDFPSETALKRSNLLPLLEKRKIHEAVYTQKALSGKQPTAVVKEYEQYKSRMNHRSTERNILTIPKHRTEKFKNSPVYRTITTWNKVPQFLRTTETKTFKNSYQTYIHKTYKH